MSRIGRTTPAVAVVLRPRAAETLTSVTASKGDNEWWEPRIAKGEPLPADVIERITADYGA